jgi:hypothetical protein
MPRKKTNEEFLEELQLVAPTLTLLGAYTGNKSTLAVRGTCGHVWEIRPDHILGTLRVGAVCRVCLPKSTTAKSHIDFEKEVHLINPNLLLLSTYSNNRSTILVKDSVCGHEWRITPDKFTGRGDLNACKICNTKAPLLKSHEVFLEEVRLLVAGLVVVTQYKGDLVWVSVIGACSHTWDILPHNFLSPRKTGHSCPPCAPKQVSKGEIELRDWIVRRLNG